jgi:hypothetical protein
VSGGRRNSGQGDSPAFPWHPERMSLRGRLSRILEELRLTREKQRQLRLAQVDERSAYDAEIAKANPHPFNGGGH